MVMIAFTVKQEKFEGPLELLLTLIEKRKFHINDVTLAKVADDFLGYAKNLADFPIAESAQFALIASTLLLIKSRSLLPTLTLTEEEEASVEELERRLRLCQRFRELSLGIAKRFGQRPLFFPMERRIEPVFAPAKKLSIRALRESLGALIASFPKAEILQKAVVQKVISLEEMIENLSARVQKALKMSFKDFTRAHKSEKIAIIVGFLALLELVRQGVVAARQEKHLGDIMMETSSVDIPRYN